MFLGYTYTIQYLLDKFNLLNVNLFHCSKKIYSKITNANLCSKTYYSHTYLIKK